MFRLILSANRSLASSSRALRVPPRAQGFHGTAALAKMTRDAAMAMLGLKGEFSKAELKRAFVAKAKEVHPDVNQSPEATKLFAEINEAFQILDASVELPKPRTTPKTQEEKLEEELEREFAAFRSWSERRKLDKQLDMKNRQQSVMWLLASAVGVLILGEVLRQVFAVYPFDSQIRKTWGPRYDEMVKEYMKDKDWH